MIVLFLCLAFPRFTFAQIVDPIAVTVPRIISPANHAVFYAPVDIPIFAYALRTNVEFFAGTNDLGRGFSVGLAERPPGTMYPDFIIAGQNPRLGDIYFRVWTNAQPGSYALTVVTSEGVGDPRTSAPVNITILSSTVTRNGPRVMDIVATDPIAISGTNSFVWPGMTNATPAWTNWPPPIWQSFTNYGPKDALFTVRCFGDDSDPTTVTYNIGGTASNGVDYVALPGSVTIPAGKSYALIPVVPIDNGPPYSPKTVVLTLTPATNGPTPDYVVGIPSQAAALILHDWPRPLPFLLPDGSFHVNASGPDGAWFCAQFSTDLLNWTPVSTNQAFQGSIDFVDPDAPNNSSRFYRAVPVTNAPSD